MSASHDDFKLPLAEANTKVGLLGGSFNPPHAGHRHISLNMLSKLDLHQIWWIVSPGNPLKSHSDLQSLEERLKLCTDCARHPKIKITAFETLRPTVYTANTLKFIKTRYPATRFVWIMGADNLAQFHLWQRWQQIFLTMPIAVHDRPGFRYKALASKAATYFRKAYIQEHNAKNLSLYDTPTWTFLTAPLNYLSSTDIRKNYKHK